MRIKTKLVLLAVVLTLFVAGAILISNIMLFSDFVGTETVDRLDAASKVAVHNLDFIKARVSAASLNMDDMDENQRIVRAIEENDRDALLHQAIELRDVTGVDFCTITDSEGTVIVRTHAPENYGDSIALRTNIQRARSGEETTLIERGTFVKLSVRTSTPIMNEQGTIVGVITVGIRLDTEHFVDSIKEMLGCETTVFLGDERIATTILQKDGARAIGTKADAHASEIVLAGNPYAGDVDILGRDSVGSFVPIAGYDGQAVGMLFVGYYKDEMTKTIQAFVRSGLMITFCILMIFLVVLLAVITRIVTPIHAMTDAAIALASGDTTLDIQVDTKDEMHTLADAFNRMIENTRRQIQIVENIASGDLVIAPLARSEKDSMNIALEKLNETIKTQAETIRDEHERVRIMLDATPLACRLWSRDFELLDCNEAAVKLFNLKDKQEYIDRYFELSPEYQPDGQSTRERIRQSVNETFEKGRTFYQWMYRTIDGTPIPAENTMVRVPYGNDYVVAAYSRDLREQNKMLAEIEERDIQLQIAFEEAKDANNAKSTFLARMSHEIRTPLNAVIGLGELMLGEGNLGRATEANLEKICTAGATILSIVNDILDISKIESGKLEMHPVLYETPSLINDIVTLNVVRIGEKPISFKLSVNENLPSSLFGDDLRVKQVFSNLLSNAFKYTNSGVVEWRITFERDGDAVWLVSSVQDTGVGIRPEDVARLFSDYHQADAIKNRKVEGTGLGLSITKRLVEMMDGSITVESEYGKGSTFHVRMRQTYVSDTPIGEEVAWNLMSRRYSLSKRHKSRRLTHVDLSYANVLVVDDITTNLDVAKGMLKPYGVNVDCATSGKQAVEIIKAENTHYNAVFMDHMMPGMDGVEATRIIREEIGTDYARNIPIIALTANATVGNEEMFLANGFQDFISKPIDTMKLDAVLRRWVRDKNLEEGLATTERDALLPGPESENGGASLLGDLTIRGLDVHKTLARFSGDEKVFIDVMHSYAKNTRLLLSDLNEYLADEKWSDYTIVIHGIKGSSYGILATAIGKAAEALEMTAKAGDYEAVKSGHALFEKEAKALLDEMDDALVKLGAIVKKPVAEEPDRALLQEMREACAAYNMDRVDAAMERLESFRYKGERGDKLVAWLREQVNNMAFEEIFSGEWPSF